MTDDCPAANKLISASSAKTILDIAVFAELVSDLVSDETRHTRDPAIEEEKWLRLQIDPKAITQPWIGYPLYVAGRTFRESDVVHRYLPPMIQ